MTVAVLDSVRENLLAAIRCATCDKALIVGGPDTDVEWMHDNALDAGWELICYRFYCPDCKEQ